MARRSSFCVDWYDGPTRTAQRDRQRWLDRGGGGTLGAWVSRISR
jgi:hypothetical protein